jgi:phenylacetate-CoA ligase
MDLEKVYTALPSWLQNVAASSEGLRIHRNRYSGQFKNLFNGSVSRAFWSVKTTSDYRDHRIRSFVQHCYAATPYYQRLFQEHRLSPDDIHGLKSLNVLPILTKGQVQEAYPLLLSNGFPTRSRVIAHTSGTTGGGLRFATTRAAIQEQWAVWWRYRSWHGLQQGTWCAYFGGRSVVPLAQDKPPFWRYNYPGKQILFSGYHMSRKNLKHYLSEIRRKQPPWIHGYPSLLALISSHMLEYEPDIGYQVRWITIGAENLLSQQRELIFRAFGVKPRQHYGLAEAVANISECELGSLHVDEDFAAIEFVPQNDTNNYKIVGTNFTNPACPLVRYDTGDTATLTDKTCSCGRPGRIVDNIDGRLEDYVLLKNGAKIGRMDHIFKDLINIREAQIYQKEPGELILRIVRGPHYKDTDEGLLLAECFKRVGAETKVSIEYVDGLERSSTGKLRFVVSDIPEAKLDSLKV